MRPSAFSSPLHPSPVSVKDPDFKENTMRHPIRLRLLSAAIACAVAACASAPTPPGASSRPAAPATANTSTAKSATVNLAPASGSLVSGKLTLAPMGDGVHLTGEIGGLGAGMTHAFHVHERGDCSAVDASSAGGHFNPAGSAHGRAGTAIHHAGDMDNLAAGADGVARVDVHLAGVSLGGGGGNDIAGRALIVHAAADDYHSQPAGNAGARVACGIIKTAP